MLALTRRDFLQLGNAAVSAACLPGVLRGFPHNSSAKQSLSEVAPGSQPLSAIDSFNYVLGTQTSPTTIAMTTWESVRGGTVKGK